MSSNTDFQTVTESAFLRGFQNLVRKEMGGWWKTRKGWVNLVLWSIIPAGLLIFLLFVVPAVAQVQRPLEVMENGGVVTLGMTMGTSVFYEFGMQVFGIMAVILSLDLIVSEKQNGTIHWLLSRPVQRRAYVLSKLWVNAISILAVVVVVPSVFAYILFTIRTGTPLPVIPFLKGAGVMMVHTLFYISLTLMLGVFFDQSAPILAIALGSLIGGMLIGGLVQRLMYITPWALSKYAPALVFGNPFPLEPAILPLVASMIWIVIFTVAAVLRFDSAEI
ncbi:MAG: ABC transporter permease subunit [Anaerolineae bacterium]|nr:ABC transporter permease subunit [Anaerolineae bacterium]